MSMQLELVGAEQHSATRIYYSSETNRQRSETLFVSVRFVGTWKCRKKFSGCVVLHSCTRWWSLYLLIKAKIETMATVIRRPTAKLYSRHNHQTTVTQNGPSYSATNPDIYSITSNFHHFIQHTANKKKHFFHQLTRQLTLFVSWARCSPCLGSLHRRCSCTVNGMQQFFDITALIKISSALQFTTNHRTSLPAPLNSLERMIVQ